MKKLMLMLAFCGALATVPAQTTKSDRTVKEGTNTEQGAKKYGMPWEDERIVTRKPVYKGKRSVTSATIYTTMPMPEDHTAVNVPEKVKATFNKEHKHAIGTRWKQEEGNYTAIFKSAGKNPLETIIIYDKHGKTLVVQRQLPNNVCPVVVSRYCSKNERIWEVDSKGEPRKYLIQEKGEPVKWFDSRGNRIFGANDMYGVIYMRPEM
jgi:hypothetical protein